MNMKREFSNEELLQPQNALFDLFEQGAFGERTNDIYRTLIGNSSVARGLSAAMEGGSDPHDCKVCTSYCYIDEYIFR